MKLRPGDPAPWFRCASTVNPKFNFDTAAGRYVVISFFGSTKYEPAREFLERIAEHGERFDVTNAIFFGVTTDPDDVRDLQHVDAGRIYFHDTDLAVSRLWGVVETEQIALAAVTGDGSQDVPVREHHTYRACTFILDYALRVIGIVHMNEDVDRQIDSIFDMLDGCPALQTLQHRPPVIVVPYVFEPSLCKRLIEYYERKGGEDSGFMQERDGMTVGVLDYSTKRRMDCEIDDDELIKTTQNRLHRRVVPAIKQAFQFNVTRIERHIVACYDAEQHAHFKAHRDNTTLGTAHRRFAVTINLNSPDYEGGEIWFPEFGPARYKAPSGAAIVFSCSLLHEVPEVTKGRRYAFLPFLYDDAAAEVRQRNRKYLGDLSGAVGEKSSPTLPPVAAHASASGSPSAVPAEIGQPDACNATRTADAAPARADRQDKPTIPVLLDGTCGCGNPNGCGTCLSARAYALGNGEDKTAD